MRTASIAIAVIAAVSERVAAFSACPSDLVLNPFLSWNPLQSTLIVSRYSDASPVTIVRGRIQSRVETKSAMTTFSSVDSNVCPVPSMRPDVCPVAKPELTSNPVPSMAPLICEAPKTSLMTAPKQMSSISEAEMTLVFRKARKARTALNRRRRQ